MVLRAGVCFVAGEDVIEIRQYRVCRSWRQEPSVIRVTYKNNEVYEKEKSWFA